MSLWQFILIDSAGTRTEVENPRGWHDPKVRIQRDRNSHGVFFDYPYDALDFHGTGGQLIKVEYELNGLNGNMKLQINYYCSDGEGWDTFYFGQLNFSDYSNTCGDLCIVSIGLEQQDDVMTIRNNYEQSVDLNHNIAFDGTTVLTDYDKLNVLLTIPGRGIPVKSQGSNTVLQSFDLLGFPTWNNISPNGTTGTEQGALLPIFETTQYAEIVTTTLPSGAFYDTTVSFNDGTNSVGTPPLIDLAPNSTLKCAPSLFLIFRVKGRFIDNSNATRSVGMNMNVRIGANPAETVLITTIPMVSYDTGAFITTEFDISFSGPINMQPGDKLYMFAIIGYVKTSSAAIQQAIIEYDIESNFLLSGLSICEDTDIRVYFINEAMSRIAESISNDRVRFYSTFFQRTLSQPYANGYETCAGAFAVTNGLNLRRRLLNDGSQSSCFMSLRNGFDNLTSMWNLGFTVEPDLLRPGFSRLRFEDWRYFYQPEIGLYFNVPDPTTIRRRVDLTRVYSRFKIGFSKWENEQYSGLNEFMTEREYRTQVNSVDSVLEKVATWILASYTAEIARRQDEGSDDYRYDNDIFGFCLKSDNGIDYEVEQMLGNATNVANISDPDTCYNGRVSPTRNAMRWFNYAMQATRHLQNDTALIFTKGTGNYIAEFSLNDCDVAGDVLSEKESVTIVDFDDSQNAKPPQFPETITFDHPMNYNTFKRIKNDPALRFKKVMLKCNDVYMPGWLDDMTYFAERGKATIVIIPENNTQLPEPPPEEQCEATVIPDSITMTGWDADTQAASIDWVDDVIGATSWYYIITQGDTPGSGAGVSGVTLAHPFDVLGITPGIWSVFIVPYCDDNEIGQNYAAGTFSFEAPALSVRLNVTYEQIGGNPLKRWYLNVVPVGTATFSANFSFRFGGCNSQGFCNGYPGAFNPGLYGEIVGSTGQVSTYDLGPGNMDAAANLTSITIFNRVGITPAQISIAPGETWTLNYL